nr:MAG TPA: hypothetical protein [Bacteriophage sp.]
MFLCFLLCHFCIHFLHFVILKNLIVIGNV